jgi:DNA anti-recombination protein RmuC
MDELEGKLDEIHEGLTKVERTLEQIKKELDKSLIANFEEVRIRRDTLGESPEEALAYVLKEAVHNVIKNQETDIERILASTRDEVTRIKYLLEEIRK